MCFKKKKKPVINLPQASEPEPQVEEQAATSEATTVVDKDPTLSEQLKEDEQRLEEIQKQASEPAKSVEEQQKEMAEAAGLAKLKAEKDLEIERQKQLEAQRQKEKAEAARREAARRASVRQSERQRSLLETKKVESAAVARRRSIGGGRGRRSLLRSATGGMGFFSRFR